MPTSDDFIQAAAMFTSAAIRVGDLAVLVDGLDTSTILQGGVLGKEIPDQLTETSTQAKACRQRLDRAAEICLKRSLQMADYEVELEIYNQEMQVYNDAWARWDAKIRNGENPAHPAVKHPYPVSLPVFTDELVLV